jgi:hypothetical protein
VQRGAARRVVAAVRATALALAVAQCVLGET